MESEKKPGYMVSLIMDYGSGRQIQISGNLPIGTTKEQFDEELDKLRLATDRQQAFVIMRDNKAKRNAEKKMAAALTLMLEEYEKGMEEEMNRISSADSAKHAPTGKLRTQVAGQIENMRAQASAHKQQQIQLIRQHEANVAISEVMIASIEKEYGLTAESEG